MQHSKRLLALMPERSTEGEDLNQLTVAVVNESRLLRELVKVNTEELRAELERSHDLHERYQRGEPGQFFTPNRRAACV
jgi:hypothetical protein